MKNFVVQSNNSEDLFPFDVHVTVHRDTTMKNNQQDALYRLIFYSKSALHVSGDVFAHHQENLTVFTVSGSVQPSVYASQST